MTLRDVKLGRERHADAALQHIAIAVLTVQESDFCSSQQPPHWCSANPLQTFAVADITRIVAGLTGTWVAFQIDYAAAQDDGRRFGWTPLDPVTVLRMIQMHDDPYALSRIANNVGGAVDEMQEQERRRLGMD